jgi:putative pyruvate formate lyase activating enzyme
MNPLTKCNLCPRNCNINRYKELGFCRQSNKIRLALAKLFFYEEPPISGKNGSGTIFFTGCNLKCIFCQNYDISTKNIGKIVSIKRLSEIMLELQSKKAHNINLVTPTIYVPQIIKAIKLAKKNGLNIPIIYNSSGYENIETIKMLDGYIDVYLPDMKYFFKELANDLSNCSNYFEKASSAIKEMYKQVGDIKYNDNGFIERGVIIRHLILPNHIYNSKRVLKWIKDTFNNKVLVSVMSQYFPTYKANDTEDINRKISRQEYDEVIDYMEEIDLYNGYVQDYSEDDETKYVPNF